MKKILSLATLTLLLLFVASSACFAEGKYTPPFVYPGNGYQSFPLEKPGVIATYRTDGTLEAYQWKDEQGHMYAEFELGPDGKTIVAGKKYYDNGNFTPHEVWETLPDKTIKESALDRDGTPYREHFWYADGKTCRQSYFKGGKNLSERETGPSPLVRETWYSNLVLRTQLTVTTTEKNGVKEEVVVDKVFRKDGTLLSTETRLTQDGKHASHTCEEFDVDGKTLWRKVTMGHEANPKYLGGYEEIPLSAVQYLLNQTIRHRTLRSNWSVAHEKITDKDGKVISTVDYPDAENAPTETGTYARQQPDRDKAWWSPGQ